MSLHEALVLLGYRSIHFPVDLSLIDQHDAAVDTSVSGHYAILDTKYPGSKFILTTRDCASWLPSMEWLLERAYCFQGTDDRSKWHPMIIKVHDLLYGTQHYEREKLTQAFHRYHEGVTEYFRGRENDLLVMDILKGDGWAKLCPFLERQVLGEPFPWLNRSGIGD